MLIAQASIELPCLENFSTTLVGQVKKAGNSLKQCKRTCQGQSFTALLAWTLTCGVACVERQVSSAVLAALDFEKLSAESGVNIEKPSAESKTTTKATKLLGTEK